MRWWIIVCVVAVAEIDLKVASKFFGGRFACGSSVTGDDEIVIQGDVKDELFDLLTEKWPQVRTLIAVSHRSSSLFYHLKISQNTLLWQYWEGHPACKLSTPAVCRGFRGDVWVIQVHQVKSLAEPGKSFRITGVIFTGQAWLLLSMSIITEGNLRHWSQENSLTGPYSFMIHYFTYKERHATSFNFCL